MCCRRRLPFWRIFACTFADRRTCLAQRAVPRTCRELAESVPRTNADERRPRNPDRPRCLHEATSAANDRPASKTGGGGAPPRRGAFNGIRRPLLAGVPGVPNTGPMHLQKAKQGPSASHQPTQRQDPGRHFAGPKPPNADPKPPKASPKPPQDAPRPPRRAFRPSFRDLNSSIRGFSSMFLAFTSVFLVVPGL